LALFGSDRPLVNLGSAPWECRELIKMGENIKKIIRKRNVVLSHQFEEERLRKKNCKLF
jgi:hypothetical protein